MLYVGLLSSTIGNWCYSPDLSVHVLRGNNYHRLD
jgi:hypothetical protein